MNERILVSRAFAPIVGGKVGQLPAAIINDIVQNRRIPTQNSATPQDWLQIFTEGETIISILKEVKEVGNKQQGVTGVYRDKTPIKVKLPISKTDFDALVAYANLDPDMPAGALNGDYKENSGIKEIGITLLIYDKATDNANSSDIPNFVNDNNVQIFYCSMNISSTEIKYAGEQDVLDNEFNIVSITSPGAANGIKGSFGTFTVTP